MENFETFRLDQTGQQTQAILDQVSTNTADIAQLRALYEALTQSEPVIIQPSDTWPVADPEENVIYRVIDRVNTPPQYYSDYMWNGTAMVLMATYNNAIDNEPTPGSNNLVKSGGVAASIVFDISAYHATGSTLATYANLAAALGTDGANVPASVRKGGMSVKFVQSSDNKYVQYRLMANAFSTTVTDWQNMCDVIAVDVPLSNFSFYAGYSYGDSGLETNSSDIACTDMLPIKDAAPIGNCISFINELSGFSYTLLLNVALFDSNKNFVRRTGYIEQTDFDVQIDNCEYFSFSIRVKDGETIVGLQGLDWVLSGFDLSKIFIRLYNYDTKALQNDNEYLVKLPLSELEFVNGKSWGNASLENNVHTIAYLGRFSINDIRRGKFIEIVNENTNGNKLNINIVGFDSSGNIISRTGYQTNWAVFDILRPQTENFSISLGLLSSSSSDIGGNVIDYGLDKVFIKLRGDSEFLKNLYLEKQDKNSIVYVPLSTYEWKDGISWGNTNIETNSKTIATGLMKTNEYGCNHKLKFINNNRNGYIVQFNIAYFNSSYALVYRTGYAAAGVTEFYLNPNYPYFALSLGLTDGTNDIGGNSLLYDLDNVFIGQKSEVAIIRRDVLKMTSLLDFSSEYLFNVENGYGDACCYNDTIFQFVNGNYAVFVYSKTGELLQTIVTTRNDKWHNNNVSFGADKYENNDAFPLIYASQENEDENKCIVYRVTGTQGNYELTVVQTISYPSQDSSGLKYQNCTIDTKNRLMIISGYTAGVGLGGIEYDGGFLRYMYFAIPATTSDVSLNIQDAIAITEPFFFSKPTQGAFCDNGFLYHTFGVSNGVLKIFDINAKSFVREIELVNNVYSGEPESAYICDNSIYIGFGDNKVYKIEK